MDIESCSFVLLQMILLFQMKYNCIRSSVCLSNMSLEIPFCTISFCNNISEMQERLLDCIVTVLFDVYLVLSQF